MGLLGAARFFVRHRGTKFKNARLSSTGRVHEGVGYGRNRSVILPVTVNRNYCVLSILLRLKHSSGRKKLMALDEVMSKRMGGMIRTNEFQYGTIIDNRWVETDPPKRRYDIGAAADYYTAERIKNPRAAAFDESLPSPKLRLTLRRPA